MAPLWSFLSTEYLLVMGGWIIAGIAAFYWLLKTRQRRRLAGGSLTRIHVALGLWFCLAALTLPELYCAFFSDHTDSFSKTNISRRWFARHVELNDQGFRDDVPLHRFTADDRRRLVFVGDSFTFGHGIDDPAERFSNRLARDLEEIHPGAWQVNNAGISGWDLREIVKLVNDWMTKGVKVDVLVYVFVLNDIEHFDERTQKYYQQLTALEPKWWVLRETYFYNQMYYRVQALLRSESIGYYDYLNEAYAGPPWERFTDKLDELHTLCERNGIELQIVGFPFLHDQKGENPFAGGMNQLGDYSAERNIPFQDLTPALAVAEESLTVNRYDAHPNARANELAAEAMKEGMLAPLFR
ncbi:MAG: SGNH/GDSL hydrolase family protein [Planctomycetaceae bacterium]